MVRNMKVVKIQEIKMSKKLPILIFVLCLMVTSVVSATFFMRTHAGAGYTRIYKPILSATSAPADGTSTITLKVWVTNDLSDYTAEERGVPMGAQISGGATISPERVGGPGASGTGTFTIRSTVPGEKVVTIISAPTVGPEVPVLTVKVTFTDPNATPATPSVSAAPRTGSTPAPAASRTASAAPARTSAPSANEPVAPPVSEVLFNNKKLDPTKVDKLPEFKQAKAFELKGKTMPNAEITVYVFSKPKMFKTKSDADGNWSVSINGLPTGTHHAELEVTDPATGTVLPRAQLGKFKVLAASTAPAKIKTDKVENTKNSSVSVMIGCIALLLLGGLAVRLTLKKKKTL